MAEIEMIQFRGDEIGLDPKYFFTVTVHPGDSGMQIAAELNEKLGPVQQDMYLAQQMAGEDVDKIKAFTEAVKGLFSAIPHEQLVPLARRMLVHTAVAIEGQKDALKLSSPTDFATFFKKNYKSLIPLMKRVIEFNDFLELDVSSLFLEAESAPTEMTETQPA